MKTRKMMSMLALVLALALPVMGLAAEGFGAAALVEGQVYTVEQMLTYAIQDEYLAQAEYKAIIAAFNADRPFSNIMKAEATHVEHLLPLFAAYKIPVPADTAVEHVVMPASLQESYETGVTAEVHNIAMYETFLKQEGLPEDVKDVFELLKKASESHLSAFQRNADKSGNDQASRGGNRWNNDGSNTNGNLNGAGNSVQDDGMQSRKGRGSRGN